MSDTAREIVLWNLKELHGKTLVVGSRDWLDNLFKEMWSIILSHNPPVLSAERREYPSRHISIYDYHNFITGIVPTDVDKLTGYMGKRILVVIQASAWPGGDWDLALEGLMCGVTTVAMIPE